ncbi:MAG: dTMP kinase [Akkermansia sp.]
MPWSGCTTRYPPKCLIPPSSFLSRDAATLSSHEFYRRKKGRLIVFEGIDGTGKSTHIGHLRKYLEGRGWKWCRVLSPHADGGAGCSGTPP